jgi:hypothetical protein
MIGGSEGSVLQLAQPAQRRAERTLLLFERLHARAEVGQVLLDVFLHGIPARLQLLQRGRGLRRRLSERAGPGGPIAGAGVRVDVEGDRRGDDALLVAHGEDPLSVRDTATTVVGDRATTVWGGLEGQRYSHYCSGRLGRLGGLEDLSHCLVGSKDRSADLIGA